MFIYKRHMQSGKSTISVLAVIVIFFIALAIGWYVYKDNILQQQQYQLKPEILNLSPEQPDWIKGDVLATVFADQKLEEHYLTDRKIASQLRDAFLLHPCISAVTRVAKKPDGVDIMLEYRTPVAMVVVKLDNRTWLYPVDNQAVVLPPREFSADDVGGYLRITHDYVPPAGQVGDGWGDEKLVKAAQIAGMLSKAPWQEMGLYNLELTQSPESNESVLYILMKDVPGFRILWGSLPGDESPDELAAPDKLSRLVEFYLENEKLVVGTEPLEIDLRPEARIEVTPLIKVKENSFE